MIKGLLDFSRVLLSLLFVQSLKI